MANFSEVTHLEDVSRWNKCENDRDRGTLRNAGACKHSTVSVSTGTALLPAPSPKFPVPQRQ